MMTIGILWLAPILWSFFLLNWWRASWVTQGSRPSMNSGSIPVRAEGAFKGFVHPIGDQHPLGLARAMNRSSVHGMCEGVL